MLRKIECLKKLDFPREVQESLLEDVISMEQTLTVFDVVLVEYTSEWVFAKSSWRSRPRRVQLGHIKWSAELSHFLDFPQRRSSEGYVVLLACQTTQHTRH